MKTKNKKTKKGFSLMETLMAVAIFSLAAVMLAGSFSSLLKNSIAAKKSQRNAESAQYAMNLMAKTLRASDLRTTSSTNFPIKAFDYSQGKCIIYTYAGSKIQMATTNDPVLTDPTLCNWSGPLTTYDLIPNSVVSANVNIVPSVSGSTVGTATISFELGDVVGSTGNITIQSTLSLRH